MNETKTPRVYFDQNCMNAFGRDAELQRIDALHTAGSIELIANPRNYRELGSGAYGELARKRLAQLPKGPETMRWGVSFWGDAVWGSVYSKTLDISEAFSVIFPTQRLHDERSKNSLHDVMHIANAEDHGADVFLTREKAILAARDQLRLRLWLASPCEFLAKFDALGGSLG